jgi:hypothetical protein
MQTLEYRKVQSVYAGHKAVKSTMCSVNLKDYKWKNKKENTTTIMELSYSKSK